MPLVSRIETIETWGRILELFHFKLLHLIQNWTFIIFIKNSKNVFAQKRMLGGGANRIKHSFKKMVAWLSSLFCRPKFNWLNKKSFVILKQIFQPWHIQPGSGALKISGQSFALEEAKKMSSCSVTRQHLQGCDVFSASFVTSSRRFQRLETRDHCSATL